MPSTINTNLNSLNAQRNMNRTQNDLGTSIARLSSGLRINSAKDDAAGLAISERFTSQIRGLNQAARNANDGISLAQTAEGAMSSIGNNLQRMRELAVQSANATNSDSDRASLQAEVAQLAAEIDRVASQTEFNGKKLLDGSFGSSGGENFQVGANAGQVINMSQIASVRTSAIGQTRGFSSSSVAVIANETPALAEVTVGGVTTGLGTIKADAKAISAAINAAGVSGLTATANATEIAAIAQPGTLGTTGAGGNVTFDINGETITVAATTNAQTNRTNATVEINKLSAITGVVAEDTATGVKLTAADGRNIDITFTAGAGGASATTAADFGIDDTTRLVGSTVNLSYTAPAGTTGNVAFTGAFASTQSIGSMNTAISAVDISSVQGANTALSSIDAALSTINSTRADLGAVQNRFSSTIENLQTNSENLAASRSRIQDADFAQETANLSRAQVLQQAGTAMIAQANQLPQQVLSLLR